MTRDDDGAADSGPSTLPEHLRHSICATCVQCKVVRSGKGSVFLLCEIGVKFPAWPKYPAQPVARCRYFSTAAATANDDLP